MFISRTCNQPFLYLNLYGDKKDLNGKNKDKLIQ